MANNRGKLKGKIEKKWWKTGEKGQNCGKSRKNTGKE